MGIISELRTMKITTAVILLSSVLYGEACIPLPHCPSRGCKPNKPPPPTTTDSPTTPDYQDSTTAGEHGNVDDRAAIPMPIPSEECANIEALEQLAFENCPRAADGFSWQEVED